MENTIRRSEMLNNENIYNAEKYKLQIQKYA
ncbi:replication protein, partial [Salmonella enterica]|nr:replication protein [Salmonella enterica]